MKVFRLGLVVMAVGLMTFGLMGTAGAFHSGGVAECGGCHSMHSPVGDSFLMLGTDPSSTCLNCHQNAGDTGPTGQHISTAEANMPAGVAPLQMTPGGDFGWLKKTYTFTVEGTLNTEPGQTHGHNIVAVDYAYEADVSNTVAPGGTFGSDQLSCVTCHDPHGKYRRLEDGSIATTGAPIARSGSYDTSAAPAAGEAVGVYRLLAGQGYTFGDPAVSVPFIGNPAAVAPSDYNRTEATSQTRVAYGTISGGGHSTWGNWCASCHPDMHSTGNYVHTVDQNLGGTIAGLYNSYIKTGDMGGSIATSYLSLVPFMQAGDYTALKANAKNDNSALDGPVPTDQVSCLSCHRAHASGWEYGLRWNMEGEFITYNSLWPGTDTTPTVPQFARGRTSAETQAAYYNRPAVNFASYQRVLCNKCHAQD